MLTPSTTSVPSNEAMQALLPNRTDAADSICQAYHGRQRLGEFRTACSIIFDSGAGAMRFRKGYSPQDAFRSYRRGDNRAATTRRQHRGAAGVRIVSDAAASLVARRGRQQPQRT